MLRLLFETSKFFHYYQEVYFFIEVGGFDIVSGRGKVEACDDRKIQIITYKKWLISQEVFEKLSNNSSEYIKLMYLKPGRMMYDFIGSESIDINDGGSN